jgi:hypothetical protein
MIFNRILSVFQSQLAKVLLICWTLASLSELAVAQSAGIVNFSGTWEGTGTAGGQVFSYKWVLSQQGRTVVGTITLSDEQNTSTGTYSMRGTVEGSRLSFEGEEFLENTSDSNWCIADGSVTYIATEDDTPTLSGEWHESDVLQGCPAGTGGEIVLKNSAVENRLRLGQ